MRETLKRRKTQESITHFSHHHRKRYYYHHHHQSMDPPSEKMRGWMTAFRIYRVGGTYIGKEGRMLEQPNYFVWLFWFSFVVVVAAIRFLINTISKIEKLQWRILIK